MLLLTFGAGSSDKFATFQPFSLALGNAPPPIRFKQVENSAFEISVQDSSPLFDIQYRRAESRKIIVTGIFLRICLNTTWCHQGWTGNEEGQPRIAHSSRWSRDRQRNGIRIGQLIEFALRGALGLTPPILLTGSKKTGWIRGQLRLEKAGQPQAAILRTHSGRARRCWQPAATGGSNSWKDSSNHVFQYA